MTRLCESCATDEPKAPSCVSPKPLTSPRPIRPEARCRSMLAIKSTSRSGSNAQKPSTRRTLRDVRRVMIWSGTISITGHVSAARGRRNARSSSGARWTVFSRSSRGAGP